MVVITTWAQTKLWSWEFQFSVNDQISSGKVGKKDRKRRLNRDHIARLSRRFHVSPSVFFGKV